MKVKIIGFIGVLIVIVVGGWWLMREGEDGAMGEKAEQEVVSEEKEPDFVESVMEDEMLNVASQAEVERAALSAVGNYTGAGEATRSFDGQVFSHTVEAGLDDPASGKFYEGWLVKPEPTLSFFSTGEMRKGKDGYTLQFTAERDYPDYKEVVITEETAANGLDGKPEAHVLEGSF